MSIFSSFFGDAKQSTTIANPLEMVMNAAGLVSNTEDIDQLLDNVRIITAKSNVGQAHPEADDAILFKVYLELEAYLQAKEPIRSFTQAELRARYSPELLKRLQTFESKRNAK
jgi:hypothetical protein